MVDDERNECADDSTTMGLEVRWLETGLWDVSDARGNVPRGSQGPERTGEGGKGRKVERPRYDL